MIYALLITSNFGQNIEEIHSYEVEERLAERLAISGVQLKNYFDQCLENYLNSQEDGYGVWTPRPDNPWFFVRGNTEQEIKEHKYELVIKLHVENKEALWEFFSWVNGLCTGMKVVAEY